MSSWFTLHPQWLASEQARLAQEYPDLRVDAAALRAGHVHYYGELVVRPSTGAKRHPIRLIYPASTPFEPPFVTPLEALPDFDEEGNAKESEPRFFDRRHQMAGGGLCLFQHETRGVEGGEHISGVDVLRRAEQWFLGHHTGRWPPDSRDSELESHFYHAGDVLLSSKFYALEIEGSGRFFLVYDLPRMVTDPLQKDLPLVVTALTESPSGIEVVHDARSEIENLYPWLGNDAWSPDKLPDYETGVEGKVSGIVSEHGYWWALPQEPDPFQNGAGLLRVLEAVAPDGDAWKLLSTTCATDLTCSFKHFFGLRYPHRSGGVAWLILAMPERGTATAGGGLLLNTSDSEKRRVFEETPVYCLRVHGVRQEVVHLRNTGVVSTSVREKTVALVGLGALGSKVAELLAQAGVGVFRLADGDWLTTGNVSRHIGGLRDFGTRKTRVVGKRILDINPSLQITKILERSATGSLDALRQFMEPADLTICTTADENVESAVNQLAVSTGKSVLYGRALRRGAMGRVFLVRPGVDACKTCLGEYARRRREGEDPGADWTEITEDKSDILLHECGRPVIPASAIDLSFVAALTARVALSVLEGAELEANHWLWSRHAAPEVRAELATPLSTLASALSPLQACMACEPSSITRIVLAAEARDAITTEVEATVSTETGGVLIGHVTDEGEAVVLRATGPGPASTKQPFHFDRDVEFVQSQLDLALSDLGPKGLYLGEWHSHLVPNPEPSPTDVNSLCGIAESPNYDTACPVMIIAGLDQESARVASIKAWSFPLGGRVHSIEIVD